MDLYIQAMPVDTYRVQSPGFPKIVYSWTVKNMAEFVAEGRFENVSRQAVHENVSRQAVHEKVQSRQAVHENVQWRHTKTKHKKVQTNAYLFWHGHTISVQIFVEIPFMKPQNDT